MYQVDEKWLETVVGNIERKMQVVRERSANKIPYSTENGTHDDMTEQRVHWWTNGFWGGMQWLMFDQTNDDRYKQIANIQEDKLDAGFEAYYGLHHDVGMMWSPTSVVNYKLTGNEQSHKRALRAANFLAGRYNPVAKFIRAWNARKDEDVTGWSIIDTMMNLPLLYWASEETGDPRYRQIADSHAHTVMNHFVRKDGSVAHIIEFNPESGEVVRELGGQGYGVGSSWSRGQGWALYGFILCYIHTKDEAYLDTAKRIAHYFIANVANDHYVPRVDFRSPAEPHLIDTTASGIAASALIEISKYVDDYEKDLYLKSAVSLLEALVENHTDWTDEQDNIVTDSSARYFEDDHHYAIIYGDFFFMEAIFKLNNNGLAIWQ